MRKFVVTVLLAATVSAGAIAYAQVVEPVTPPAPTTDARSLASDREVGEARRYYRAQCERSGETHAFCECVTAGVAQALMPAEVRIAANGVDDRLPAQGDATMSSESDALPAGANSADRIAQVEGHYADACAQFRG
ncbi:MAG: hypothetical protein AB7T59_05725 [Hyphomonadaceae bacterium]